MRGGNTNRMKRNKEISTRNKKIIRAIRGGNVPHFKKQQHGKEKCNRKTHTRC